MKKILIGLLVLGSFSSFAQQLEVIKHPRVNGRYLHVNSDADMVCVKLGFSAALEGSKKKSLLGIFNEQKQCDDILKIRSDGSEKKYFCKIQKIKQITCY